MTTRRLMGIVGAPGSGKSTLAARLAAETPDAAVLPMDGFHLPQARLRELGRRDRMGGPDTFDVSAFGRVLRALRGASESVSAPGFDRDLEEPVDDAVTIGSGIHTVYVEGNYLLHDADGWEQVAELLDEVWYLEVDDELRRQRLQARHERFGKSPAEARAWMAAVDEPNAQLIAKGRSRASRIVAID